MSWIALLLLAKVAQKRVKNWWVSGEYYYYYYCGSGLL